MEAARVLIVEDEPFFREMLQRSLSDEPDIEVVGMTDNGDLAVQLAEALEPDAILMDIEIEGTLDGIEAALRIKQERPKTGIVILSAHRDRRYITGLPFYDNPGWSYLLKQTVPDVATVVRAIQGCMQGMIMLDPAVVEKLRPKEGSALERLTKRQRSVLELMAQGYNNAGIAERLTLAEKSVGTYINVIYQELEVSGVEDVHARVRATILFLNESQSR
ncbi:MAG: response regulator transcription factor [Dehalococcoidia bacterium]|nr:response regulator transcription factor [Dehalococcoidia bacterium]